MACNVYDRSNTGMAASNSTRINEAGLRMFFLWFPPHTEALRQADPPSREFYQMLKTGLHKLRTPDRPGNKFMYGGNSYLCPRHRNCFVSFPEPRILGWFLYFFEKCVDPWVTSKMQ